jgi:uncharacterized protein YecE (DUF72 family)
VLFIGTSGWQYKDWARKFYPKATRGLLTYYAERFRTVEINASFYRLPSRQVFEKWARETPDDFVFAVKASRFLTHFKKLKDPEEPVSRLIESCSGLGAKLGVILVQLPGNFTRNDARLQATLEAFPNDVRVAVEFRNETWFAPEIEQLLKRYGAALCVADRRGELVSPVWRTTTWWYLRLHQGEGTPLPCYRSETLKARARLLAEARDDGSDQFIYFNNDTGGCALDDAITFAREATALGMSATRTPKL